MQALLKANRYLIAVFGVMSGGYKLMGGAADVALFGQIGMSPALVMLFGAVQSLAGLALMPVRSRRIGADALVLCNALASNGLFAAGVQPFGAASLLFIAMAALELRPLTPPSPTLES